MVRDVIRFKRPGGAVHRGAKRRGATAVGCCAGGSAAMAAEALAEMQEQYEEMMRQMRADAEQKLALRERRLQSAEARADERLAKLQARSLEGEGAEGEGRPPRAAVRVQSTFETGRDEDGWTRAEQAESTRREWWWKLRTRGCKNWLTLSYPEDCWKGTDVF